MRIAFALLTCLTLLSACFPIRVDDNGNVVDPKTRRLTAPEPATNIPLTTAEGSLIDHIDALPRQPLAVGHCGLFLWARTPEQKLVFFSDLTDKSYQMRIRGRDIAFARTRAEDEIAYGLFGTQELEAGGLTLTLRLEVEARDGLADGAVVPRASLRLEDSDGWEVILPTAGLVGCQSETQG